MPLRLDIKKKFAQRSERVKSVDLHLTEPWILASLYSGTVCIWNYQTQTITKSFEMTELPVRSAKFIPRNQSRQHICAPVLRAGYTFLMQVNFNCLSMAGNRLAKWVCVVLTDEEDNKILLDMQKGGLSLRRIKLEAEINLQAEVASCGKRKAERKVLSELQRLVQEEKFLSIAQKNYLAQEAKYGDEDGL